MSSSLVIATTVLAFLATVIALRDVRRDEKRTTRNRNNPKGR